MVKNGKNDYCPKVLTFSDTKIHLRVKGHAPGCDLRCLHDEAGHGLASLFRKGSLRAGAKRRFEHCPFVR